MSVASGLTRVISGLITAIWQILPRWGRWVASILLVLWLGWTFLIQERHGGAVIVVKSVVERPISYVYVNGNMGSNTFAFDGFNAGGGMAGPYRIDGDAVKIDWLLSATLKQQEKHGTQPEKQTITLPMPKRNEGQNYFYVLFLPHNKVMVRWSDNSVVGMNDVINTYRTRK
ncbi:membrane protein [Pectobacterium carotovorum]|uniref:membrane protein n=1 Tax=Pectobacterium carotovorum TaxID=554 RepID=UPI00057F2E45|nr:membrane protein [Pectobacterium carotovorum]KHT12554.1 membrane protein [Pectobacterium carotovorum subsp. carotovorum]